MYKYFWLFYVIGFLLLADSVLAITNLKTAKRYVQNTRFRRILPWLFVFELFGGVLLLAWIFSLNH